VDFLSWRYKSRQYSIKIIAGPCLPEKAGAFKTVGEDISPSSNNVEGALTLPLPVSKEERNTHNKKPTAAPKKLASYLHRITGATSRSK